MNEWIKAKYNIASHYLMNEELKNINKAILISYRTMKGHNYVTIAQCNHGRISKGINGIVTAFMFLPKPYKEQG